MSTRPCPNCHEIIPADLDYCPYCNSSTRETLQTADDVALSRLQEQAGAATATTASAPLDSMSESSVSAAPPIPSVNRCIMCNMAPATVDDYCLECRRKLDMGPEQWDLIKQDADRKKMIGGIIAAVAVLALIIFAVSIFHKHRAHAPTPTASPAPSP